jgi:Mg-chelatase subunit ChlD
MVDLSMSYDVNGVVQVHAVKRDTLKTLPMTVEAVPDDLSWLGLPPQSSTIEGHREPIRVYLLIDGSSSMAGPPLEEAQAAARAFLETCDFTSTEVGLISFSDEVTLQAEATDNARRVLAAIGRLSADGTTNLADALILAREKLAEADRARYIVLLTDGYPDATEAAVWEAALCREDGIQIVAIGIGDADRDYLRRLASTEAGSIFTRQGELVQTFGHIARVISQGGKALRIV